VADAVYRVLMAGGVLRDPLLVGAVAEHAEDDTSEGWSMVAYVDRNRVCRTRQRRYRFGPEFTEA
jgi:hypothetical protein